jgi:uncharacterized protein
VPDYIDEHFEWDLAKSEEIFATRDFDFELVARMLANETLMHDRIDDKEHGEERVVAIGQIRGLFITAVYTMRGGRKRIITAWRSTRREIDEYFREMGSRDEGEN